MSTIRCRNCGFSAEQGWGDAPITGCPECCGRMHVDGGFGSTPDRSVRVRHRFVVTPWAPADARRAAADVCSATTPDLEPTISLLVSELVTNSVRHAGSRLRGTITMDVRELDGRRWRVEIADDGPGFAPPTRTADDDVDRESGWGLRLVDELSDRWGVERGDGRTRVWFEAGSHVTDAAGEPVPARIRETSRPLV